MRTLNRLNKYLNDNEFRITIYENKKVDIINYDKANYNCSKHNKNPWNRLYFGWSHFYSDNQRLYERRKSKRHHASFRLWQRKDG